MNVCFVKHGRAGLCVSMPAHLEQHQLEAVAAAVLVYIDSLGASKQRAAVLAEEGSISNCGTVPAPVVLEGGQG